MLLSKLAYLVVKNAIYYANPEFNYESFTRGDFDDDSDYALNINNAFSPINEAIARLSDLDKLAHIVSEVETADGYQIGFNQLMREIDGKTIVAKEVISVGDENRRCISFKPYGLDSIILERPVQKAFVEFKPDLPFFSQTDIGHVDLENNVYHDSNIDLTHFGINESVCNYIIEYAQGRLMEPIAPELANMHLTRAETYFANLKSTKTAFPQKSVADAYGCSAVVWFDNDGFRIN